MPKGKVVADKYRQRAIRMMREGKLLKIAQKEYEDMSRLQARLPDSISKLDWVNPNTSTAPYDALKGATRALANLQEDLNIDPVTILKTLEDGDDESNAAKNIANLWETVLQWELGRSDRRRKSLRNDVIWSVATFDEVVARIVHLPTQFGVAPPVAARKRAAMRFGDWAVNVLSPLTTYVEYSEYMPEAILVTSVKSAEEMIYSWGKDKVPELVKELTSRETNQILYYVEYDYVDHVNGRVVWYHRGVTADHGVDGYEIMAPQPWLTIEGKKDEQVPFLPYVAVAGGTTVDIAPEFQRKPLLFSVKESNQWHTANIVNAIVNSKAVAMAAAPEHIIYGPGGDQIDIDYTTPGGKMLLPTTTLHRYEPAPQRGLDPKLVELGDRNEAAMQRTTVAEVLVTARPISGEQAFASYNLQVQQALASIGNIKDTGERFYEQLYESMLLISHYTGQDIESYAGTTKKYFIDSEEIDPENIQLDVELKTDIPMDRLARINAAAQLKGSGIPFSDIAILESLGETNAEGEVKEWEKQEIDRADLRGLLQYVEAERSGLIQQMAQEMAQGIIQQAQQQQAQGPQQPSPQNQGVPGVEGEGFNPAQGGIPPAVGGEGGTREDRQAAGLGPIGRV